MTEGRYIRLGSDLNIRNDYNENLRRIEEDLGLAVGSLDNAEYRAEIAEKLAREALDEAEYTYSQVNSLQKQIDTLVVEGDSSPEAAQARTDLHGKTYASLKERIDADQSYSETMGDLVAADDIWEPPTMPATRRGIEVPSGYDPDEHLDALMEPLLNEDPEYVKREDLGLDQSGTYQIRMYSFTPKRYTKTIMLTACIHGNEYTGFYSLAQFLGLLVRNWQEHPQLYKLRKSVRIIAVPMVNPWGFANQKRQNVNGVDVSRNFPKYWDEFSSDTPGDTYYKGTAPLSEAEAKLMDDLFKRYKEATAHVDFHTTNVVEGEYVLYLPRLLENKSGGYERLVQAFRKAGEKVVWAFSRLPEFTTNSCHQYGMAVSNPEFVNDTTQIRSSVEMTRAMRWYGNVVLEAAKMEKPKVEVITEPFVKLVKYRGTGANNIIVSSSNYNNINPTLIEFESKIPGILTFHGSVTFSLSDTAKVGMFLHMYQQYHNDFSYADTKDDPLIEINHTFKQGTHTIPINQALQVLTSGDDPIRPQKVVARLRAKIESSTIVATIHRYQGVFTFMPATNGERFEYYDATGRETYGTNAMQLKYPF